MVLINANLLLCIGDIHNEGDRIDRFRFASLRSLTHSFISYTADNFSDDATGFIKKGIEFFDEHIYRGPVLSKRRGTIQGPSGKETYYNLNMSGCVRNMNRRGYYYDVWVRDDGVKMFGDYIMCAANLGVHPFGSLVECSLGTCIVVDTGGFAAGNPNQLDIAVTW
jgi:hypothetical protein